VYDESLSHQLYAALDFLLAPSHYEPCGLTQLIAMRYGAIPIVRATGGLKDTVFDCEDPEVPSRTRNGFVFHKAETADLFSTLKRAIDYFRSDAAQAMMKKNMRIDWGWKKPAEKYLRSFKRLLDKNPIGINIVPH
jgi:starch synthase